ncbi:hypothetical protein D3C84_566630 [compost metagenome]
MLNLHIQVIRSSLYIWSFDAKYFFIETLPQGVLCFGSLRFRQRWQIYVTKETAPSGLGDQVSSKNAVDIRNLELDQLGLCTTDVVAGDITQARRQQAGFGLVHGSGKKGIGRRTTTNHQGDQQNQQTLGPQAREQLAKVDFVIVVADGITYLLHLQLL